MLLFLFIKWSSFQSQVVWKDTRYVGVATAKNKDWFITVARYSPRGNIVGQFRDNVPAAGKFGVIRV